MNKQLLSRTIALFLSVIMLPIFSSSALAQPSREGYLPGNDGEILSWDSAGSLPEEENGGTPEDTQAGTVQVATEEDLVLQLASDLVGTVILIKSITLTADLEVASGKELQVAGGADADGLWTPARLTVPEGISLKNCGTVTVTGILEIAGVWEGDAPVAKQDGVIEDTKADDLEPAPEDDAAPRNEDASEAEVLTGDVSAFRMYGLEPLQFTQLQQDAMDRVHAGLVKLDFEIDLSEFSLSSGDLASIYVKLLNDEPELSYVESTYTFTLSEGLVSVLVPAYSKSKQEVQDEAWRVQAKIREIIAACITPGMSEMEKALAIHDYICVNYEYGINGPTYNYPKFLLEGRGVCEQISNAYVQILKQVGITAGTVNSNSMVHTWNVICIDDQWYHVDITWDNRDAGGTDDPEHGYARHKYFLVSDSLMFSADYGHYGMNSYPYGCGNAASTKYDSAFWEEIETPVAILEGSCFYTAEDENGWNILKFDSLTSGGSTVLAQSVSLSGAMSVVPHLGRLYYNTDTGVYSCLPDGSGSRLEGQPDISEGSYITRMYIVGNAIHFDTNRAANNTFSLSSWQPATSLTLPETMKLSVGDKGRMVAAFEPKDAEPQALSWYSSDPNILFVNETTGQYEALCVGTAEVQAVTPNESNLSDTCSVTVTAPLKSIALSGIGTLPFLSGTARQLSASGTDVLGNVSDITATGVWTSSNEAVATVNGGMVTAVSTGTAVIRCAFSGKTGELRIQAVQPVTEIRITNTALVITRDRGTMQMSVGIMPANAYQKSVLWEVENSTGQASITANGRLTAIRDGEVTVRATATDGSLLSDEVTVTISNQSSYALLYGPKLSVTALTLNRQKLTGEQFTVAPLGAGTIESVSINNNGLAVSGTSEPNVYCLNFSGEPLIKGRYAQVLNVTTDQETFVYAFTVTVIDSIPSVSVKIPKINLFYPNEEYPITVTSSSGSCTVTGLEDMGAQAGNSGFADSFDLINNALRLHSGVTSPALKGYLLVNVDGYAQRKVAVSLSKSFSPVRLKASAAAFTLNKASDSHCVSFTVYDAADPDKTPLAVNSVALQLDRSQQPYNDGQLTADVDESGVITVTLLNEFVSALTRSTKVDARLTVQAQGWQQAVAVTMPITVQTTGPSAKYSGTSLRLNRNLAGEKGYISVYSTQLNVPVTQVQIDPYAANRDDNVNLTFANGRLMAQIGQEEPAGVSYSFYVTPVFSDGTLAKRASVTVSISGSQPTLSLAQKGSILLLNRENSALLFTPKLGNTLDSISALTLDDLSLESFTCSYSGGVAAVKLRTGTEVLKNARYSVTFIATLADSGKTVSRTVTVTPSATLPKLSLPKTLPVLYGGVAQSNNVRNVHLTASYGSIRGITLVPDAKLPAGLDVQFDAQSQTVKLALDGLQAVRAGKYTLTLRIAYEGQPGNLPGNCMTLVRLPFHVVGSVSGG